jgi:hypothetical protein
MLKNLSEFCQKRSEFGLKTVRVLTKNSLIYLKISVRIVLSESCKILLQYLTV